jgi:hypothetical protein
MIQGWRTTPSSDRRTDWLVAPKEALVCSRRHPAARIEENTMPKLTDTQFVILAAAAKRDDGSILPLPKKVKLAGDAADKLIEGLIKKKLAAAQPATAGAAVWRTSEDGQSTMLVVSEAGLRAIGLGSVDPVLGAGAQTRVASALKGRRTSRKGTGRASLQKAGRRPASRKADKAEPSMSRAASKQAKIVEMLRRSHGASIAELMKATGWQAHSVRGVISGALKKKLGLEIASEKSKAGERRYRIAK